jgi:uncharacterized repeat protein (TIGR01451 family)
MARLFFIIPFLLILPVASAAETLYPTGSNFIMQYNLSTQTIGVGDTLTISRVLVNNESFPISGLYFSENIPSEFSLVENSVTVNGGSIDYEFDGSLGSMFPGNRCYYWVIDAPDGSVQNHINPGDSVVVTIRLTCSKAGNYVLPLHTGSFLGNTSGFFATDDAISITVTSPSADTVPPDRITDLEAF